jgi:hypothetical protein
MSPQGEVERSSSARSKRPTTREWSRRQSCPAIRARRRQQHPRATGAHDGELRVDSGRAQRPRVPPCPRRQTSRFVLRVPLLFVVDRDDLQLVGHQPSENAPGKDRIAHFVPDRLAFPHQRATRIDHAATARRRARPRCASGAKQTHENAVEVVLDASDRANPAGRCLHPTRPRAVRPHQRYQYTNRFFSQRRVRSIATRIPAR